MGGTLSYGGGGGGGGGQKGGVLGGQNRVIFGVILGGVLGVIKQVH